MYRQVIEVPVANRVWPCFYQSFAIVLSLHYHHLCRGVLALSSVGPKTTAHCPRSLGLPWVESRLPHPTQRHVPRQGHVRPHEHTCPAHTFFSCSPLSTCLCRSGMSMSNPARFMPDGTYVWALPSTGFNVLAPWDYGPSFASANTLAPPWLPTSVLTL